MQLLFAFLSDVKRSALNLFCNTIVIINIVFGFAFPVPVCYYFRVGNSANPKQKVIKMQETQTQTVTLTYEHPNAKDITAYAIFPEAWTPEDKIGIMDEAAFAHYVINEHDENDLHEWIMRLINNVLSDYNFDNAETVEEFNTLAEAALKDTRGN